MFEVPKRHSLIDQVAESLRRSMERGEWSNGLPAERKLSDLLQVSRPTLREALRLLQREGCLRISEKNRRRIPVPPARTRSAERTKLVAFVTSDRFDHLTPFDMWQLYQLRRHLQDAGVPIEVVADARLKKKTPQRVLREITRRIDAGCWVLHRANARVQRWFAEHQFPVIVMGTCHEGVRFPSLDWDNQALGQHAATQLMALGHRRIALVNPHTGFAGDQAREEGFLHVVRAAGSRDLKPLVLRHDGTPEHIRRLVRSALRAGSPPTAFFVSQSLHALNVLTTLLREGKRVPQDVSLLSGDQGAFLAHVTPALACYELNWNAFARRLSRLAVQLIQTGVLPKHAMPLTPRFCRGESLATPP